MTLMDMSDKSPSTQSQQTVPQATWNYNMNMYNMYQNPYMYGTTAAAYGAQYPYPYYGTMPSAEWGTGAGTGTGGYPGYGHGVGTWMVPPQQHQPIQQQQTEQKPAETTKTHLHDGELPPLPPGPPPQVSVTPPPGTMTPPPPPQSASAVPHPASTPSSISAAAAAQLSASMATTYLQHYASPTVSGAPVRFNMSSPRARSVANSNSTFLPRPFHQAGLVSKKNKNNKKAQGGKCWKCWNHNPRRPSPPLHVIPLIPNHTISSCVVMQAQGLGNLSCNMADDEDAAPPLPASPPPPLPPPPPITAPPPPPPPVCSPAPTSVPQQPPGVRSIEDWPQSLREYVNKCYSKCVSQIDTDRVGVILKGKIMRATSDGTLWTKNWGEEPLPLLDSDAKPGGLTLGMNLKQKLGKISSRLGPKETKSDSSPAHKRSYRPSFKRSYSSSDRSSSSSDSEDNTSNKYSSNSSKRRDKKSWNKKHQSKKQSDKHIYKEYGSIGGGCGGPIKKEVLDRRAARFSSVQTNGVKPPPPVFVIDTTPNWGGSRGGPPSQGSTQGGGDPAKGDWEEDLHIIGTCVDIEKRYLRLTSAPEASAVRPPQVLAKALAMVKDKWAKAPDYHYTCEQLKSIRQDLTVQGIRDDFTVEVYETHARIALEKGDHAEFNQCQSQLRLLHTEGSNNRGEFIAYRILYYIFTNEFLDLSTLVHSLSKKDKEEPCIRHAVSMAKAWVSGLHSRLFKLYLVAPRMSPYLIDWFLNRERTSALRIIVKAYRPAVPIEMLTKELAFTSLGDCLEFVDKFGLVYTDNSKTKLDCKLSTPVMASV